MLLLGFCKRIGRTRRGYVVLQPGMFVERQLCESNSASLTAFRDDSDAVSGRDALVIVR